jgi:hypothetical protein
VSVHFAKFAWRTMVEDVRVYGWYLKCGKGRDDTTSHDSTLYIPAKGRAIHRESKHWYDHPFRHLEPLGLRRW